MLYRFDIDGLRALAILAILVFHIDPRFAGGFIGVDIFFVISGFLITGIIWRDLENNIFSFQLFYLKRIRRLFPALFVMLLLSFLYVLFFGLNTEIEMFGKSMLSSLYYASNIFFYSQSGYFDSSLELNPLLHTWSLSVEEQFYLIFPLTLYFIYKQKNRVGHYLIGFLLLSFLLSEMLISIDSSAAFFLSPSRFWQFLVGSLIAIYINKINLTKHQSELIAVFGFSLITIALFLFSEHTPFPGLYAAIPTLGTALLIIAGVNQKTVSYKILSSRLSKFFGNISYSLYLWHWPIIVFYKITISPTFDRYDKIAIFLLSILTGYISWRYIEKNSAKISITSARTKLVIFSSASIIILSILGITAFNSKFFNSNDKQFFEDFLTYKMQARTGKCFLTSSANDVKFFDEGLCINQQKGKKVLLIGDSHAAHYYQALQNDFSQIQLSQVTSSGCRPLLNYSGKEYCNQLMKRLFDNYIDKYEFDLILISGRWLKNDEKSLHDTLRFLKKKNKNIILLGPVIEYNQPLPALLARFGDFENQNTTMPILEAQEWAKISTIDNIIERVALVTQVPYVSILKTVCPQKTCALTTLNGEPLQFDGSHFTTEGASLVLNHIFDEALNIKHLNTEINE